MQPGTQRAQAKSGSEPGLVEAPDTLGVVGVDGEDLVGGRKAAGALQRGRQAVGEEARHAAHVLVGVAAVGGGRRGGLGAHVVARQEALDPAPVRVPPGARVGREGRSHAWACVARVGGVWALQGARLRHAACATHEALGACAQNNPRAACSPDRACACMLARAPAPARRSSPGQGPPAVARQQRQLVVLAHKHRARRRRHLGQGHGLLGGLALPQFCRELCLRRARQLAARPRAR
jgi:hypothetical protein